MLSEGAAWPFAASSVIARGRTELAQKLEESGRQAQKSPGFFRRIG